MKRIVILERLSLAAIGAAGFLWGASAHAASPSKEDLPPPLTYQIVSVRLAGGGTDEQGSVMLEQQTGRSWILIQRGSAPPAWQALSFDSGFTLNQQLVPPEIVRQSPGQK